jgi:hypothetical protein
MWYGACICLLHGEKVQMTDKPFFTIPQKLLKSNLKAYALNNSKTNISATALKSL